MSSLQIVPDKAPPPVPPKPAVDAASRTTIMKLRVNFSPDDRDENVSAEDSAIPETAPRSPQRKNSLLLEGMMNAMQKFETMEPEEELEDSVPDAVPSWVREDRRDSIEKARTRLSGSGMSKGKNQRDRRKLRDKRRSTGVALINQVRNSFDLDPEDSASASITQQNTVQNENIHPPIPKPPDVVASSQEPYQVPASIAQELARFNAVRSQLSEGASTSNSEFMRSTNALFDELDRELDALMRGLDCSSEKGSYTDSGVGSDYGSGSTQL